MPSLSDHQSATTTKLLVIGDSGSGKTGAMASLVQAGYNLKIVDFDNGLDILAGKIKQIDAKLLSQVEYETCTDQFTIISGKPTAKSATAWMKGVNQVEKFYKAGFTPKDILVIDTITFAAEAAKRYILQLNGRLNQPAQIQDWGAAMNLTENLIAMVTSVEFNCNVICNAHVKYIGNEESGEPVRGYPALIGKELAPKIGRYFNSLLLFRSVGSGAATSRRLYTNTYANIELKNPNPANVKPDYKIDTGLAEYFKAVRGA